MATKFNPPRSFADILAKAPPKPATLKGFLISGGRPAPFEDQGWMYYAWSYAVAFEQLAEHIRVDDQIAKVMRLPMLYLCRHSIELYLKAAIIEMSSGRAEFTRGENHNLLLLWRRFQLLCVEAGFKPSIDHDCAIQTIHQADPTGEHFRYPSKKELQKVIPYTSIENLVNLVEAHRAVIGLCNGTLEVLIA
jgi:hypothetical protein